MTKILTNRVTSLLFFRLLQGNSPFTTAIPLSIYLEATETVAHPWRRFWQTKWHFGCFFGSCREFCRSLWLHLCMTRSNEDSDIFVTKILTDRGSIFAVCVGFCRGIRRSLWLHLYVARSYGDWHICDEYSDRQGSYLCCFLGSCKGTCRSLWVYLTAKVFENSERNHAIAMMRCWIIKCRGAS